MTVLADTTVAYDVPEAIRTRDCALAIWNRPVSDLLARAVSAIDLDRVEAVSASMHVAAIDDALNDLLCSAGYPVELRDDAAELVHQLALIMRAPAVTVRVEPIATDACRRFHADYATVRLLKTYVGSGTQWRLANRDEIRSLGCGDVALFKGRLLLDPPLILHRSPPIAGTGERRLLLVVDAVMDI